MAKEGGEGDEMPCVDHVTSFGQGAVVKFLLCQQLQGDADATMQVFFYPKLYFPLLCN
jgi:hypothetical protein